MAIILSVINNKGGTGKTTTVLNLGAALAKKRKKVLLVDFDAQANLTSAMGANGVDKHIGDVLLHKSTIENTIIKSGKLSLIPSTDTLSDYEYQVNNEPGREFLLKEALSHVEPHYDYIIIDCAPNLGIFSMNSLVAAHNFIVPMQAENFAFIGLDKILQLTTKIKARLNPNLDLAGILIVRLAQKTKFSQAVISNINENDVIKDKLFNTNIRQDISLMECTAFGQTIFDYAPKSRGAEDYKKFANEISKHYDNK
ncbi:ParA family protein [Bacteroidales bacterium]|nr:ParA family protein [Bacteroidales bacterium]